MKNKKTTTPTIFQKFSWREYKKVWCEDVEIAREEGREEGRKEAYEEGIKEGERAQSLSIALAMLKDGLFPPKKIAKYSGLSLAEVEALKASL